MEVVTLESKAFKDLIQKIDVIIKFISTIDKQLEIKEEDWIDNYDVCKFLKISKRTLQRLRSKGLINYSIIDGKTYYKISEIKRILEEKLIRSKSEYINDLIENHRQNAE